MTAKRLLVVTAAAAWVLTGPCLPMPVDAAHADAPAERPAFSPVSTHGGLVYVSAVLPPDPAAGFEAQAAGVLDELRTRLAGAGTSLDRVVSATVALSDAADFGALNTVWTRYWPSSRPTRTTIVARLPLAGARLQVSAVAAAAGTTRDVVVPPGWQAASLPYSPAIRAGHNVFLSGIVSRRGADNALVKGDIETQTRAVFENARAVLEAAGLALSDVASVKVFLVNTGDFERMNAVYRTYFPAGPPARATVAAALTSPDYLIEITMTAATGGRRSTHVTPNADGSPGRANPVLSSAVRVGPQLFLSGMLGVTPGTATGTAAQAAEALGRLERTMAQSGYGWPHVADCVVYVTDVSEVALVLDAIKARAGGRLPSGSVVGAGLTSPAASVEIMLTAGR